MLKKQFLSIRIGLFILFIFGCSVVSYSQTEISNAAGLSAISNDLNGNYILTSDIVLNDPWTPIANFRGTLDGNGHIISGMTFNNTSTSLVGLFANTSGATIKKLGIENANLVGQQNVAGIVGVMTGGTIEQCYVSNSYIQGTDRVASLVGQALLNAVVKNCYATAYIYATSNNTGGLIGSAKALTLSKCYFSGEIRAAGSGQQAGGLVGYIENGYLPKVEYCVNLAPFIISNSGTAMRIIPNIGRFAILTNNYSLSSTLVGTSYALNVLDTVSVDNSYYGLSGKNGANLPNDADAKSSTFYSEVLAWDFTPVSGEWKILDDGYPVLQWQTHPVKSTVLNLNTPHALSLWDVTNYGLNNGNKIDFTKLISSHGLNLNISCTSPKVSISANKIATISTGTTITTKENVSVNISSASTDFSITNSVATIRLSPGVPFPNFTAYPDGIISDVYNAGPGLALDNTSTTSEDSKMVVISSTNEETFTAYIESLLNNGFMQINTNRIEDNLFYTLQNENKLYYLYYTASKKQVRIIQDMSSRTMLSELDASSQGIGETEFYLYSLDYTHGEGQTSKTDYWKIDCGAMLIMKLKDNSLFIVDAGHERQSSKAALDGLLNFMYQITGQEKGTTLNIRSWFFSHAHGDHVYMTYPFLEKYHDVLNVESVMFNIPSYQIMSSGYDAGTFLMKQTFNKYYPNCKYVKLHTGQHFSLQGVSFDVLFTHEDGVNAEGVNTIGNFNDTSTILQITMDGKKIMLLGDTDGVGQSNMLSMFSGVTLQSDCVQTTHHGYNDVTSLYKVIKAPLAFYCNSITNAKDNNMSKYLGVVNATSNVKVLYADPYTIKITVKDGVFQTDSVPSYRSYFKTVEIPNLSVDVINSSGNKVALSTVLSQPSLANQVIDKSVTGTAAKVTGESCSLVFDGSTTTKYCTENIPASIVWTMKNPVTLKYYVIYTANDNATKTGRNPQKWVLSGSNDGTTWTCIDSVNNANLPNVNYQGLAFAVSTPTSYQYYAMKVFSTAGASVLQFSELGLYGDVNSATDIPYIYSDLNKSVNIYANANKQIIINYVGSFNSETTVTLYNLLGVILANVRLAKANEAIKVDSSGTYIAVITNEKYNFKKSELIKIK